MDIRNKIKDIARDFKTDITIGTVTSFDALNNIADVYIDTDLHLNNVPIITTPGFHCSNLKQGDIVYIIFTNNSVAHPKIIGKGDEMYAYDTRVKERHLRKGDLIVSQVEKDGEITTPSSSTWLDQKNTNSIKYGRFFGLNSIEDADKELFSQGNFVGQDVGIYSPTTSSIIKIKEDGSINIFTETNNGIRIDPTNKTIEFLGNNMYVKSNNWTVKSNNVNIEADDTISIKSKHLKIEVDNYEMGGNNV